MPNFDCAMPRPRDPSGGTSDARVAWTEKRMNAPGPNSNGGQARAIADSKHRAESQFLTGGGEMGEIIRRFDWAATPLGPLTAWPQSLRTAVDLMLSSRYAMFVWWGHELINLYNDAYRPFLGGKHPHALGQSARQVWAEIWDLIGPRTEAVLERKESTFDQALLLLMERFGYPEETYFTFSYSPIRDDRGEVGGLFCAVTEETQRVIGERRLRLLREVAAASGAETHTAEQVCAAAAGCFASASRDLPFALLYLSDRDGRVARLAATAGIERDSPGAQAAVDLQAGSVWPLSDAAASREMVLLEELPSKLSRLPGGAWDRPPERAVVVPLREHSASALAGFLVAGLNPYLPYGEEYRGFIGLLADQITAGIARARAYDEERRRAEGLAEIDRAKTAFFSNVSHEFRTPLTLMLGPLEDANASPDTPAAVRVQLELAHRNALRLLKLVNSLLDFSRLEAGRVRASYSPTDLGALTRDLASTFRAAVERAGLRLIVDCETLEPVYVDREMWEKVVLNLLSNALKFTWSGEITVRLRREDSAHAMLVIADTGVGIAEHELPHLFKRFHRIEGTVGRTQEGSGIGLALVQEFVHLHGGEIDVASIVNKGTTFRVTVPLGTMHLPADRIKAPYALASTMTGADAYVLEALRWSPDRRTDTLAPLQPLQEELGKATKQVSGAARVLLVDDNADMRAYLTQILSAHYRVETAADGEAALEAIRREPPDLMISDVMMPRLDGLGLLKAIRADRTLAELPIILLSARAGEEASIEGLHTGADDYLIKPFSARELLARIGALLKLTRLRAADHQKNEFLAMLAHELRNPLAPILHAADVLSSESPSSTDVSWAAEMISTQAKHMARMLEDVLDVARMVRKKLDLRKEHLDVVKLIQSATEAMQSTVEAREHELVLTLPGAPLYVHADPTRLEQAVANLINNAAKYTERHGRIQVTCRREGSNILVSVKDDGIGIDSTTLPKLFQLFSPGHQSDGLGIGLWLVREIVAMHAGSIEVASEGVGKGSEFRVYLPSSPPHPVSAQRGQDAQAREGIDAGHRVLVVDDRVEVANSLARLLKVMGHEVHVAHDGAGAIDAGSKFEPEVILLDIGLTELNGYDVCRQIRQQPWGREILIVAVTGWARESDIQHSTEAGFDRHLAKPVDRSTLARLLASVGSRVSSRRR
jgi:signal transduction histidine kinase